MFNREAARALVHQDLELMDPKKARSILRNSARMEHLVDEKMARLESRKALILKRGATEIEAEDLAMDGIQAYDPEEERAWRESQAVFDGWVTDEDIPG